MKRLFTLALVASATVLSSCIKEQDLMPIEGNTPITVEVENPQTFPMETKSSYTEADLNRISDLNILVYHNGTLLPRCSRYFNPAKNISIDLPSDKDGFNIYMLGNVGNITKKVPTSEADMVNFQHIIGSYNDFRTNGFPVANKFENFTKGTPTRFKVKRLVGQYNFTITTKSPKAEYTIKAVKMKNCALDIYPFMDPNKPIKAQKFADNILDNPGDYLSAEDIAKLNAGQPVDLYFLENLQGTLLPGNTDPKKKGPNFEHPEIKKACTFLEIVSDVKTPAASYIDGKYRYFLGADATTNFDVHRARKYNLNISMSADMVTEEGWRVEVEAPVEYGEIILDKSHAIAMQGLVDAVFIDTKSCNSSALEYTIEYAQSAVITDPDKHISQTYNSTLPLSAIDYQLIVPEPWETNQSPRIYIRSNRPLRGTKKLEDPLREEGTIVLAIKSMDKYNNVPLITKYIVVKVYTQKFPIIIKKGSLGNTYAYVENPFNVSFTMGAKTPGGTERLVMLSNNAKWKDTEGNWVTPKDKGLVIPDFDASIFNGGSAVDWKHEAIFSIPKWDMFNCIDYRNHYNNPLNIVIKPYITTSLGKPYTTKCTDGKVHTLIAHCAPELPYPQFKASTHFSFSGYGPIDTSTEYYYGLGVEDAPDKIPSMPDNTFIEAKAGQYAMPSGSFNVDKNGFVSGVISDITDFYLQINGKKYYPLKDMQKSLRSSGHDRYDYTPFYIANGNPIVYKFNVHNDEPTSIGEKNATLRGFYIELYGPGRDVENTVAGPHYAQYFTKNMKQFGGNIHRWHLVKDYTYQGTYLTVNGCSHWYGGSKEPNGIVTPSGIQFNEPQFEP